MALEPTSRRPVRLASIRARWISAILACLAFAPMIALSIWLYHVDDSVQEIERLLEEWGAVAALVSIGLMIAHSFAPFPAEMLAVANGMLFGPVWGVVITWIGAMLGAWLAFALARTLGRPFVESMVPERRWHMLDRWSQRRGGAMLLVSRLIPVISFNLINYAAGLTTISWWTFTWATGLGILPITILAVLTGAGILTIF